MTQSPSVGEAKSATWEFLLSPKLEKFAKFLQLINLKTQRFLELNDPINNYSQY